MRKIYAMFSSLPAGSAKPETMKTVAEYIKSTEKNSVLIEAPVRETEKALGFECVKINACGNPYNGITWLPKSQLKEIANDFYTQADGRFFLCPEWLYKKAFPYGEVLA